MSLKGTKTKENLEAAFAGESQANRRYLYFAQTSKDTMMLPQYLDQQQKVKLVMRMDT
ncbi:hypothetical protein N9L96_04490 [Candidatus Pelagibacter bacterium]|nr:hypothetical protein [Candidatus Pelagibacter bacterium]